jgi:hypothetical protein
MADSVFWRDLADQFEKLQDKLRAGGKITKLTYKTLEGLAIKGASKIAPPDTPTPNLLLFWLKAVRKEDPDFRSPYRDIEGLSLAEFEQNFEIGSLDDMCQNSATFCRKLQNQALQAKFEKKHRNAAETRTTAKAERQSAKLTAYQLPMRVDHPPPGPMGKVEAPQPLRFVRRGNDLVAKHCNDMEKAIGDSYSRLLPHMNEAQSIVRSNKGITASELESRFKNTYFAKALNMDDWQLLIEEFGKKRPVGCRNLMLGVLSRRTGKSVETVATYTRPGRKRTKSVRQ